MDYTAERFPRQPARYEGSHDCDGRLKKDIARREFYFDRQLGAEDFYTKELAKDLAVKIRRSDAFLRFLCQALDLPF